jgi:hypothetical protein
MVNGEVATIGVDMLAMGFLAWSALVVIAVVILVLIAFWPARVASRKGHSFLLFFLFSLIFFPAAIIVAYVIPKRRDPALTA